MGNTINHWSTIIKYEECMLKKRETDKRFYKGAVIQVTQAFTNTTHYAKNSRRSNCYRYMCLCEGYDPHSY